MVQVEGSLSGVSLTINMKETVENLRVRNKLVKKNAKRLTRGIEKRKRESILIEFDSNDPPK